MPTSTITSSGPLATDLARALGRLRRSLNRAVRASTGTDPLPEAQIEVLRLVERRPGIRVREAAAELRLAPNTVSTLIGRLIDARLLEREADVDDGRVARLRLTAVAVERLRRWRDRRQEILSARLDGLSEADRSALAVALPALERAARALEAGWDEPLAGGPGRLGQLPAPTALHGA